MKELEKPKWTRAIANEIGCLIQGIRYIKGTDTCFFIRKHKVSQNRNITYNCIICDIRPQKQETHIVQLTVGGNKLYYNRPGSTHTADLTTAKLYWKIVLSTPDGKYLIVDVNNFYLNNPMKKAKYYKILLNIITQ